MKEINSAYEEIQKIRSGNSNQNSGSSNYSNAQTKFANVRRNLSNGNVGAAEAELNATDMGDRAAEWHYLMGIVLVKKGYYVDAQRMINTACRMDPTNAEYRAARDRLNMQGRGYGGGYRTDRSDDCTGCDICSSLLCADCCCECMGGDLISCC